MIIFKLIPCNQRIDKEMVLGLIGQIKIQEISALKLLICHKARVWLVLHYALHLLTYFL